MVMVEVDSVLSYLGPLVTAQRLSGVGVHVEARKVAAGDVQANAVTLGESVAYRKEGYGELVDFPRAH